MKTVLFCFLFLFALISCYNNGIGRLPVMGWNTWCTDNKLIPCLDDFCNEQEILSIADYLVSSNMSKLGYKFINLDDCWADYNRSSDGSIRPDPTRFPNGMKYVADYLHSRGLFFGLYTDVGEKTCKYGRTGSWPYYQKDAQTFASWGMDFIKMDWCGHPSQFSAQELYTNMSKALNSTGRAMFFNTCEWGLFSVWEWAPKIANAWRIGPDHLPVWWTPDTNQDPGQGHGTANIIQHLAGKSKYASFYGWNDPDFLMVGLPTLSQDDWVTEFSFWSLVNANLLLATDVRKMGEFEKGLVMNEEIISVNQDPLGISGDLRHNSSFGGQIWSKLLSGGRWAFIAYNSNILFGIVNMEIEWNNVNFPGFSSSYKYVQVRDIVNKSYVGNFTLSQSLSLNNLKPHQSRMFVITPSL